MKSLRDLKETLWQSYRERKSRYYKFRKIIAVKAKTTFLHLLKQRAFQGKLSFDHKKQEIRIQVNPAGESQHGSRKDPKSLSGGEKSFAQICMLLSVWEAMGSPIRALDELYFSGSEMELILVMCLWTLLIGRPVWR
jgi:chromosome segregation ATPase